MNLTDALSRTADILPILSCPRQSTPWIGFDAFGIYTVLVIVSVALVVVVVTAWLLRRLGCEVYESESRDWFAPGKCETPREWATPGEWVRPLSSMESLFIVGTMNIAQVLYLESSQTITPKLLHQALTILAERVLVLQLSVAWRWWWPWYRRMNAVTVHLKESSEDPLVVYQRQLYAEYQVSEGPLWRATLVQPGPNCQQTVLVLTLHHAVSDGTTNMVLSRDLLTIINGLITGQRYHTPCRDLVPPISQSLTSSSDLLTALTFFFFVIRTSILDLAWGGAARLLPRPPPAPPVTMALCHDFSKDMTGQLYSRCKEEGVRVSSCLLAASTLAYLHTAQQDGRQVKEMEVTHETAVNIRRYYPARYQEASGSVAFFMSLTHHVGDNDNFWVLARRIQQDLYTALDQEKKPLRLSQLGLMLSIIFPLNKVLAWLGFRSLTYSHVFLTNMGDLRTLMPATYPGPVHISKFLRSTASEYLGTCFAVVTQTFAGRLLLSLDHFSTKTTDETARSFFSSLTQILTEAASHSTPTLQYTDTLTAQISNNGHIPAHNTQSNSTLIHTHNGTSKTDRDMTDIQNNPTQPSNGTQPHRTTHTRSITQSYNVSVDNSPCL